MTLCASISNKLELTGTEDNEMAEIDSFIELNPDMMLMGDDGCLDYLDMSEIFPFGDDYKSSSAENYPEKHEKYDNDDNHEILDLKNVDRFDMHKNQLHKEILYHNIHSNSKFRKVEFNDEDLKQESINKEQFNDQKALKQNIIKNSQLEPKYNNYIQEDNRTFVKTENHSNVSNKKTFIKLQHNETYVKESSLQHDLFECLSPVSHYNDLQIDDGKDKKTHLDGSEEHINDINLENKISYFNEDILGKINTVCKQESLQLNPYNWSVDEVNRWLCWVSRRTSEKTSSKDYNDSSTVNKNDLYFQLYNKNQIKKEFINDQKCSSNLTQDINFNASSSPSYSTCPLTNQSKNVNFEEFSSDQCNSMGCKNYNFNGSDLCNLSHAAFNSVFPELADIVLNELEIWKNAGCLLENIASTDYKDDSVFSTPFETRSMNCDNDQQAFFNNLFQPFPSPHSMGNFSSYSDTFVKQTIRSNPLSFFTNPQLSTSTDPVLSQPSFFLSSPSIDLNDYNSPSVLPDFFFPSCIEMSANSFSPPSSASPSSIHSDYYDPSHIPITEPQPELCVQSTRQGNQLWQFLKELLHQPKHYETCIRWIDEQKGIFKIEDSIRVAKLWGERKNRPAMNYDKLSRSIRQYYKKGIIKKTTQSKRLVYQFCQRYL